jgi:GxxExxY protein
MNDEAVSAQVVDAALRIHKVIGPGMLESAYEAMLEYELNSRGLGVERQKYVELSYRSLRVERAFCIDLLVNGCVVVEVKSQDAIAPVHMKQVLTYLKMTNLRIGLLINFGQTKLVEGGIRRLVNGYPNKEIR